MISLKFLLAINLTVIIAASGCEGDKNSSNTDASTGSVNETDNDTLTETQEDTGSQSTDDTTTQSVEDTDSQSTDDTGSESAGGTDSQADTVSDTTCPEGSFDHDGDCVAWTDCTAGQYVTQHPTATPARGSASVRLIAAEPICSVSLTGNAAVAITPIATPSTLVLFATPKRVLANAMTTKIALSEIYIKTRVITECVDAHPPMSARPLANTPIPNPSASRFLETVGRHSFAFRGSLSHIPNTPNVRPAWG